MKINISSLPFQPANEETVNQVKALRAGFNNLLEVSGKKLLPVHFRRSQNIEPAGFRMECVEPHVHYFGSFIMILSPFQVHP